jgi:hypothetical protein
MIFFHFIFYQPRWNRLRIPLGKQDLPAFAKASPFIKTSARQVGAAGRIIWISFLRHFPEESGETQSA